MYYIDLRCFGTLSFFLLSGARYHFGAATTYSVSRVLWRRINYDGTDGAPVPPYSKIVDVVLVSYAPRMGVSGSKWPYRGRID